MADNLKPVATQPSAVSSSPSYLEWGPVWAGALIAIAISTILVQFGTAAGLTFGEPIRADGTVSYNFIVAALWVLLVSVAASGAAGYIAGRMRMTLNDASAEEVEFRDGIHGITAWALATLVVAAVGTVTASLATVVATAPTAEAPNLSVDLQDWVANQAIIGAFATAAGSALGAAAAWFASICGGQHREEGTSHNVVVPAMFKRK